MKATRSSLATINSVPSCVRAMPYGLPSSLITPVSEGSPPTRLTTAIPPIGAPGCESLRGSPGSTGPTSEMKT